MIFCGISLVINIYLYSVQRNLDLRKDDQTKQTILFYLLSLVIAIIISVVDKVIEKVLEIIIKKQSYTWSHFYANYSTKLSFFSFF